MVEKRQQLSLITYNIHKGFSVARLRFLLPQMREALASLNPDFVFLQEVQGEHKKHKKRVKGWPDQPQVAYIAEERWPYYLYAKNAIYQSGHHGNAILSKYPFERFENINLSNIHRASRSILHGQIEWVEASEKRIIHLLCVHLGLFKSERIAQCQALISRINDVIPHEEPLLIAGDFNDWRRHLTGPLIDTLGVQEAFYSIEGEHARSFPAIRPALCVDRIYFRGMNVLSVACLTGKPWRLLSDHVPLLARFELPS
ncbi:MAG: endonuclease/exonuclease/phosphatase family protein [Legionella sp.]|nr:endonuclease/exonuclease/phosphatase family protein [Legionella sp.]